MDLLLNDHSFSCQGNLADHWKAVTRFGCLLKALKLYGVDKVVCPGGYKEMALGDVTLKSCYPPSDRLTYDQRNELITLMDRSLREPKVEEMDCGAEFSECTDFQFCSVFLGNAYMSDLPVVSFTFDARFECESFEGFFRRNAGSCKKVTVRNLYEQTETMPVALVAFPKSARKKNAQQNPMWNFPMVEKYLKQTGARAEVTFRSVEEKQAYLIKFGTMIALLNGWRYHQGISTLNSRKNALRYIFYSANFRQQDTYLSIDLEHTDIRFELCDHDGCHLREIKHDGSITNETPQRSHNIKVF